MIDLTMNDLIERTWRQNEIAQPACPEMEIERLRREVPSRLGMPMPDRYVEFLRKTQGLSTNAGWIAASRDTPAAASEESESTFVIPGIIEHNEDARIDVPSYNDYLIIAYSDMDVHGWDNQRQCFSQMMHGDSRPMTTFDTFDKMIIVALWEGLLPENLPDPWKETCPTW